MLEAINLDHLKRSSDMDLSNHSHEPMVHLNAMTICADLYKEMGGTVWVTNLKEHHQHSYYCLVISDKNVKLLQKVKEKKHRITLDLATNTLTHNETRLDPTEIVQFGRRIAGILKDVRAKHAVIMREG